MKQGLPTNFVEIFVSYGCAIEQIQNKYHLNGVKSYKLIHKDDVKGYYLSDSSCFCDYRCIDNKCTGIYYIPIQDSEFYVACEFENINE